MAPVRTEATCLFGLALQSKVGVLPDRQGPGRARRTPSPLLDLLATLDPARHNRPRPTAVIAANEHTERPAPTVMTPLEGLPGWVDNLIKLAAE